MRLTYMKRCLILLFLFLSPEVFAQGLFQVVPTDKSLEYLGHIFGGSIGAIHLGGTGNPLLSRMFEKLNFIVVTFGVVILAYIGIAGAINTAREGEALGKKFTLWVPLRAMMGMLLMVPTPGTGYSAVQMTVIWFVLNGVGAANSIWNVVLDQLAGGITAVGGVTVDIPDESINNVTEQVLKASTCMSVINSIPEITTKYGRAKVMVTYFPMKKTGPISDPNEISQEALVTVGLEKSASTLPGLPPGLLDNSNICGSFKVSTMLDKSTKTDAYNPASLLTRLNVKVNALLAIFSAVEPATSSIATARKKGVENPKPQPGYVPSALKAYRQQLIPLTEGIRVAPGQYEAFRNAANQAAQQGAIAGAVTGSMYGGAIGGAIGAGMGAGISVAVETWEKSYDKVAVDQNQVNQLKKLGWIHAGSYYYALSKQTKANVDADAKKLPVPYPDQYKPPIAVDENTIVKGVTNAPKGWNQKLFNILATDDNRVNLNDALTRSFTYYEEDKTTSTPSLPALGSGKASTGNGFMDAILTPLGDGMRGGIIRAIQEAMGGEGKDPLVRMGKMGFDMMVTAEAVLFTGIIAAFAISLAFSPGACLNPAPYSGNWLLTQLFTLVYILMAMIWSIGATLGIYTPMVPYILFTSTAVGWFIAVIEAVVAAPFVALALVQPSGEELGNIKQAISILMNVFIKPSLMIFGFVIAGSLLRAVINMINFGFISAVDGSIIPSLFGIIPILGLYAFFVIGMINQCFSLIYELPNKVLRYMGMSSDGYNPKEAAEQAQKGFQAGEAIAGKEGAIGSMASHAGGGRQAAHEKYMKGGGGQTPGTSTPGDKGKGDGDDKGEGGDKDKGGAGGTGAVAPGGASIKPLGGGKGGKTGGDTGSKGGNQPSGKPGGTPPSTSPGSGKK